MIYFIKMAKPLTKILIFSLIISFALSFKEKNLIFKDFIKTPFEDTAKEGISYLISYEKDDITNSYLEIKIKSKDANEYLYAYFSPISQNRNDSYLLNSGKDEIKLYINKAFTKSEADGVIYLSVGCFSQECTFTITPSLIDTIKLSRNSQYTYFTTDKKNLINTFTIPGKAKDSEADYISFWATGNKNIQMNVQLMKDTQKNAITSNSFDNGIYTLYKETDEYEDSNSYIIQVTAPADCLITFGNNINTYKANEINPTQYIINTNEIYGILSNESTIQCFEFNIGTQTNSYLNVLDFNKNLDLIIKDKNSETKKTIENGNILFEIKEEHKDKYFCLSRVNNELNEDSPFSLQVTYDVSNNYYKNIYSPQIDGFFYERYLEKGQLAFFTGLPSTNFKTELRYYLKKNSGYPEMYLVKCTNYPKCTFDINSLPSDAIKPKEINDMFSYSIFKTEAKSLISQEQYVLLVYCNGDSPCSFQTNFYSESDKIVLQKDKRTYHTIMSQGENNFLIKLIGEKDFKQIFVNFLTYSGDISIQVVGEGYRIRDFLAGNKKYFVLDYNTSNTTIDEVSDEIYYTVKGELASFYSVDYKLIKSDEDKIKMFEESGINYLETIEPKVGSKTISLKNRRLNEKKNFAVNFFSINCKIDVTRKISDNTKTLETFDFVAQDVILNTESIYNNDYYNYFMEIKEMDNVTQFDMNWCMVYVSSIEQNIDTDPEYQKRHLLISESVINRVILNKDLPSIEYIYPHINPKGYVVMNLNWQTNSKVTIIINIENKLYKQIVTSQSQYVIIPEKDLRSNDYCPYLETRPNQVCSIVVQIKLDSNFYNDEPIMEFSIKSQEVIPAFIRKSMLRKDIVVGNYYQYFYTEVGIQEEGNINIKFDRGSGKVYGRIVPKNANEGKGWMNRIILPDENNDDLKYNYFTKKLFYGSYETRNCEVGCYLLLKVEPNFSDEYFKSENIAYPITLSLNAIDSEIITPTQDEITVVDIPLNEFIVGDTVPYSDRFGYFYSLFIPFDCEELIIEFLCESSFIFVNVGDKKPLMNETDFGYQEMDTDGILKITKKEILEKLEKKENESIKNVQLTIAIGAQYFDDDSSSVYSFRVRAYRQNEIELISLTTDQETLCNVKGKSGNCYFIIPQNRIIDEQTNIFFHAVFLPNVEFNYYANEILKEKITNRDQTEIKNLLPTKEINKWSNSNSRGNYLYIDNSEISDKNDSYIVLNLEVNLPYNEDDEITAITLLHQLYSYKGSILPNPASAQLFLINNNNLNNLEFKFNLEGQNLLIRLKSVSGKGVVYWDKSDNVKINGNKNNLLLSANDENIYYYFNYPGDSVTLTLGTENNDRFPLHFKNENPNTGKKDSNVLPGFGFYCFYEREAQYENYNYIDFGENSLYNFRHTDFPFIFYSMISDKDHTIDVNIKLTSLTKKNSNNNINLFQAEQALSEIPSYNEFSMIGAIMDEDTIYLKHVRPDIQPQDEIEMINGIYDPINKIFRIQFTPDIIKKYNVEGNNYIYIRIDKGINNTAEYDDSSMDISILPSNNDGYVVEKSKYIYGKIPVQKNVYNRYELSRINSFYKFMRIEFSSNYKNIAFTLNTFKMGEDTSKIDFYKSNINYKNEIYNGKTVLVIELTSDEIKSIFLSVFNTQNNHDNDQKQLSNFVFKYDISDQNNFIKIKPKDNKLTTTYERSTLNIELPSFIDIPSESKVNYIFKLLKNDKKVENENLKTISLIESNMTKVYKTSSDKPTDVFSVALTDIHNDSYYYVLINAEVVVNTYTELFSYEYLENPTSYVKPDDGSSKTTLIILFSILGGVILIGIIFLIICCHLRKGNLMKSNKLEQLTQQIEADGELPNVLE